MKPQFMPEQAAMLKTWYVDIGDFVKEGQRLADIETPELDAQLRQAEADVNVAIAKNALAQITAARWINLLKTDSVSKQERDEKVHTAQALAASVIAARANRDRLRELVGFERVIAPFSGTISARGTDIGDLINAGNQPNAKPLFRIIQSDPLRLYVKIPEAYSSRIKPNMKVTIRFAEHPGQRFQAQLINTADAIDPQIRTLLAQFLVHNQKKMLLPGSYS
jgi:RND family efflux transporter MFP subunit